MALTTRCGSSEAFLYAGQCLVGIIKSAAAAAADDDHNHAALSNDQRSAWAGRPSARPGPARPGPARPGPARPGPARPGPYGPGI